MQIIDKPKKYRLPFRIQKRISSQSSQAHLPNMYIQSRSSKHSHELYNNPNVDIHIHGHNHRKAKSSLTKDRTISYVQGKDIERYRPAIRKGLATNISFQIDQNGANKFLNQQLIAKLKESIKAVSYKSQKFTRIFTIIKQIFSQDVQFDPKDILTAYGSITQSFYVFFTSSSYKPQSLCCKSSIFIKIENNEISPLDKIAKIDTGMDFFHKFCQYINRFICSKCFQTVLIIQSKSEKGLEQSRSIGRQATSIEAQRQKISMSIIVASGKFKNNRIDEISQRDINLVNGLQNNRYRQNPEDMLRRKSRTLILRPIDKKNNEK